MSRASESDIQRYLEDIRRSRYEIEDEPAGIYTDFSPQVLLLQAMIESMTQDNELRVRLSDILSVLVTAIYDRYDKRYYQELDALITQVLQTHQDVKTAQVLTNIRQGYRNMMLVMKIAQDRQALSWFEQMEADYLALRAIPKDVVIGLAEVLNSIPEAIRAIANHESVESPSFVSVSQFQEALVVMKSVTALDLGRQKQTYPMSSFDRQMIQTKISVVRAQMNLLYERAGAMNQAWILQKLSPFVNRCIEDLERSMIDEVSYSGDVEARLDDSLLMGLSSFESFVTKTPDTVGVLLWDKKNDSNRQASIFAARMYSLKETPILRFKAARAALNDLSMPDLDPFMQEFCQAIDHSVLEIMQHCFLRYESNGTSATPDEARMIAELSEVLEQVAQVVQYFPTLQQNTKTERAQVFEDRLNRLSQLANRIEGHATSNRQHAVVAGIAVFLVLVSVSVLALGLGAFPGLNVVPMILISLHLTPIIHSIAGVFHGLGLATDTAFLLAKVIFPASGAVASTRAAMRSDKPTTGPSLAVEKLVNALQESHQVDRSRLFSQKQSVSRNHRERCRLDSKLRRTD